MNRYLILLITYFFTQQLAAQPSLDSLRNNAQNHLNAGHYNQAIEAFQELIPSYQQQNNIEQYIQCHFKILLANYYLENYTQMLAFIANKLPNIRQNPNVTDPNIAGFYLYEGLAYYEYQDYANAFNSYKNAYQLLSKHEVSYDLENAVSELAFICKKRGDYQTSLDYYQQAISLKEQLGMSQNLIINDMMSIARLYESNKDEQLALHWFTEALEKAKQLSDTQKRHKLTARIYNGIGHLYYTMNKHAQAIEWLQKCMDFCQLHDLSLYAVSNNMANALIGQRKFRTAISYINQSHQLRLNKYKNKKAISLARVHSSYGKAYLGLEEYDSALWHLQVSLINFLPNFNDSSIYENPSLETTNSEDALLYSLGRKGLAFVGKALKSKQEKDSEMAIATLWKSIALIDKMRQQYEAQGSKQALAKRTWWLFDAAIKGCWDLYYDTGNPKYLSTAFQFAEKSKAILLQDAAAESLAQLQGNIPQAIRSKEHQLKNQVSQLETQLYNIQKKQLDDNMLRAKLLQKREDLRLFTLELERNFPKYHQLKHQFDTTGPQYIQAQLADSQAMISYFLGDEKIYIFSLTAKSINVKILPNTKHLDYLVYAFRKSLLLQEQGSDAEIYKRFSQSAYQLHEAILGDVLEQLPKQIQELTIIPDGILCYVPFDLLLSKPTDYNQINYAQLAYLIHDYEINYAYAASLANKKLIHEANKKGVLAFAPNYESHQIEASGVTHRNLVKTQTGPLLWNVQEIEGITQYFPTMLFKDQKAIIQSFQKHAPNYQVIHLAMHALVNDQQPMQSHLVFSKQENKTPHNTLSISELYKMKLNADLAVLSACNTGLGKYLRGEGIISIGQGFSYAGCPSVVLSHWAVDDQATAQLMQYFYQYLAQGKNKAAALRLAKLDYLNQAKARKQHPIYWGAFSLYGNKSSLSQSPNYWWLYILGILSIGSIFYRILYKKKSSLI